MVENCQYGLNGEEETAGPSTLLRFGREDIAQGIPGIVAIPPFRSNSGTERMGHPEFLFLWQGRVSLDAQSYQMVQRLVVAMGWPVLQAKAFWNSGRFTTTPFTRNSSGEWGSVCTRVRRFSGRLFWHQPCP